MAKKQNIERLNWVSWTLIVIANVFAILALAPFFDNQPRISDFVDSGPVGGSISEFGNMLIGVAGVAMMFLAFYMQYRANRLVIDQFEIRQFESRFFELLKMHKENSEVILNSFRGGEDEALKGEPITANEKRRFEYITGGLNRAYERKRETPEGAKADPRALFTAVWRSRWEDSFGHYFRHLFQLVRFVVEQDFLTYEDKRSYLRIARASLSTYEQIFLYYNWLSGDGHKWEDDENHYFTDYRIIHNINYTYLLPEFDIREISPFKELLAGGGYMTEKGREYDDLFEFESRLREGLPPQ